MPRPEQATSGGRHTWRLFRLIGPINNLPRIRRRLYRGRKAAGKAARSPPRKRPSEQTVAICCGRRPLEGASRYGGHFRAAAAGEQTSAIKAAVPLIAHSGARAQSQHTHTRTSTRKAGGAQLRAAPVNERATKLRPARPHKSAPSSTYDDLIDPSRLIWPIDHSGKPNWPPPALTCSHSIPRALIDRVALLSNGAPSGSLEMLAA